MSRFSFRLERILWLRSQAEKERARALGSALRLEDERRRRMDDAHEKLSQVGDQLTAGSAEVRAAGLLHNLGLTMAEAADRVEEATSSHAEAEVKVREEEQHYREARKDRRVLELLRERRHEIWKLESSREEQKDIDSQAQIQRRTGESA